MSGLGGFFIMLGLLAVADAIRSLNKSIKGKDIKDE